MAWERRKRGGRYYTRSRRKDGRIIREYIGYEGSDRASRAEREARQKHAAKVLALDALERAQERTQAADTALADYCADIERQYRAALTAAGYHQHKRGEWRRRRDNSGSSSGGGNTGH